MSDLVAVIFDDPSNAFQMRATLVKMQTQYLIELEDAVVVSKGEDGKVKLHQAVNLTAVGAFGGGFWGMLIGTLFFMPFIGAAVGAGTGALSGKLTDAGISDEFMRELGNSFKPNTAALFILIRKLTADKVFAGLGQFKGKAKVLQTSLTHDTEEKFRQVLEARAAGATV
jgi:uncharacterized membrane protein